ncbi:MAG TPA: hypothetical protein DD706_02330 [Nitrospiraceae bacterium]|nr:hypothetical protein [Nitrospiraceae bacterium]
MLVNPTFFLTASSHIQIHTPRLSQASLKKKTVTRKGLLTTGRRVGGRMPVIQPSPVMTSFFSRGLRVG